MRLNLGCGQRVAPGFHNVDRVLPPAPQGEAHYTIQAWDLDRGPWPWYDESVSGIEARDIFEHVNDPVLFMTESWRVLQPAKYLHIHTPHFTSLDAFTDPTHKRFPTEHTFDYWIPGTVLYREHNRAYGGVSFELANMHMDRGSMDITLRKLGLLDRPNE